MMPPFGRQERRFQGEAEAFAGQALRVTGIDVNEGLLKVARAAVPGVEFRVAVLG
jgi:hypothetical protein